MAEKIEQWKSDDDHIYGTEVEALRADVDYWKRLANDHAARARSMARPRRDERDEAATCGPGGGQSNLHP